MVPVAPPGRSFPSSPLVPCALFPSAVVGRRPSPAAVRSLWSAPVPGRRRSCGALSLGAGVCVWPPGPRGPGGPAAAGAPARCPPAGARAPAGRAPPPVETADAAGETYQKELTINVNDLPENSPPTDLALSSNAIDENVGANTAVGTFSTTDPDTGDTFTYTLVAGTGDTDNAAFTIVADQLQINSSPDFETKSSYNIRVETADAAGETYQKQLTININDLNEAPTIGGTTGNDILRGGATDEIIDGGAGADRLYGNGGDDTIYGDSGSDIVYGGDGDDYLDGGDGNDRLYGDGGSDTLLGGEGNDLLYGRAGDDLLDGGAGSDRLYGDAGADTFVLASGMGRDSIYRFEDGTDAVQLDGLTFADLEIVEMGSSTLIEVAATGEDLAILSGVNAALVGASDFI